MQRVLIWGKYTGTARQGVQVRPQDFCGDSDRMTLPFPRRPLCRGCPRPFISTALSSCNACSGNPHSFGSVHFFPNMCLDPLKEPGFKEHESSGSNKSHLNSLPSELREPAFNLTPRTAARNPIASALQGFTSVPPANSLAL